MIETLTGAIATISTATTLGFVGYAASSAAVISGVIALPALSVVAGIVLLHTGIKELRG
ncbi:hypothetical protein G7B40_031265 [Aetokthonos hydrillicola Thurmond2011]|jgi:hypothetical protein|uniref:Uncharacterized protein n=1 Tax=Aetokthonos hydrillicola Thurmond2011 TaxID=2712845 RepID=A0AAP5ICD9_9CYAN|nr:hypothetical protein [Aetokthonos hydrillicola]MBW4590521.1 hypothetical protein [Aetokthonos hydrillicola CCALA 1050]MDR9899005.1 hypothetical protein [Aetokthonos hydrillicola Thurmond2011]